MRVLCFLFAPPLLNNICNEGSVISMVPNTTPRHNKRSTVHRGILVNRWHTSRSVLCNFATPPSASICGIVFLFLFFVLVLSVLSSLLLHKHLVKIAGLRSKTSKNSVVVYAWYKAPITIRASPRSRSRTPSRSQYWDRVADKVSLCCPNAFKYGST